MSFDREGQKIPFPCLRLGNYDSIKKTLDVIARMFATAKKCFSKEDFSEYSNAIEENSNTLYRFLKSYKERQKTLLH